MHKEKEERKDAQSARIHLEEIHDGTCSRLLEANPLKKQIRSVVLGWFERFTINAEPAQNHRTDLLSERQRASATAVVDAGGFWGPRTEEGALG